MKTKAVAYAATHKKEARAYIVARAALIKTRHANYRAAHKEEVKTYNAAYYAAHSDICRAASAAYLATHRDEVRLRNVAYRAAHPEELRERNHRRRAHLVSNGVYPVSLKAVQARDGMCCHICGKKVRRNNLHFDHVIPIVHGGPHAEWNIRVAHAHCNLSRGAGRMPGQPYLPMAL